MRAMVRKELLEWEIFTLLVTFGNFMCNWVCVCMNTHTHTHTATAHKHSPQMLYALLLVCFLI